MRKYLPQLGVELAVLTTGGQEAEQGIFRIRDFTPDTCFKLAYYSVRLLHKLATALNSYHSVHEVWKRRVKNRAEDIIKQFHPSIVIATYPPIETLELGLFFSENYDLPLVADFRDGMLFEPIQSQALQNPCAHRYYQGIERRVAERSKLLITVSPVLTEYFCATYPQVNAITIPNGYDPSDSSNDEITQMFDEGRINVVYTGNLGLSDAGCQINGLLGALNRLAREPFYCNRLRVHLAGRLSPREKHDLGGLIAQGLIRYHGLLPREQCLALQKSGDILLLITSLSRSSVATGKLFEYLLAGKPILALTAGTFAESIVLSTGTGWVVHPQSEEEIYRFFTLILSDPDFAKGLNRQEQEIEKYSCVEQMRLLGEWLHRVCQDGPMISPDGAEISHTAP